MIKTVTKNLKHLRENLREIWNNWSLDLRRYFFYLFTKFLFSK